MSSYPVWPFETIRRHGAKGVDHAARRDRVAVMITRDEVKLGKLARKIAKAPLCPELERQSLLIQKRYVRHIQEWYALGGIPKNLRPY